jgi:hypothetical protein
MSEERQPLMSGPYGALVDHLASLLDELQDDLSALYEKELRIQKQLDRVQNKKEKVGEQVASLMEQLDNINNK